MAARHMLPLSLSLTFAAPAAAQYSVTLLPAPASSGFLGARALGAWTGVQVGAVRSGTSEGRAALWFNSAASFTDLHPTGYHHSRAAACDAVTQVGFATTDPDDADKSHAMLWRGAAATALDLHPSVPGYDRSQLTGVWNGQQCGFIRGTGEATDHAGLWSGTAASFVDLHPPGYFSSIASAIGPGTQAGSAYTAGFEEHAMLWRGSAASAIDLHPAGYSSSRAFATDGPRQGGEAAGIFTGRFETHAVLWHGSAAGVVDLHPLGYDASAVYGIGGQDAGGVQAGEIAGPFTDFNDHAAAWRGSRESMIDLHQFLPATAIDSRAFAVAPDGTVVGEAFISGVGAVGVIWAPSQPGCSADFDHDGDSGTDSDIEAFFACLAGNCCATCGSADFNHDGDTGTDADIEAFFRVLAGGTC